MKKKRNNRGFTLAELLIVVAIITVLAGVGFIAVQSYQKSMAQLEADAIAKEIFIAAQNHLTMAESQGYTSESVSYGNPDDVDGVYYFKVPGDSFSSDTVLGRMLPFGSIDETIRAGGNYVVRYQANPARVLDVFYGSKTGRYKADPTTMSLSDLVGKNYGNSVIGWYGGADTQESGVQLNAPVITVENAERLTVTVDASKVNVDDTKTGTDKSIIGATDLSLKLFITNADETAMAAIPISVYTAKRAGGSLDDSNARVSKAKDDSGAVISNVYCVVLDDITTADMHFADINGDKTIDKLKNGVPFKPGEDITVYAVAYSNTTLCSIVYSNAITVNSLFADCHEDENATGKPLTAYIGNFRHLENLDGAVSGLGTGTGTDFITVNTAEQIVDLGKLPESENGASGGETGNGSGEGTGASGGETGNGSGEGTGASGGGTNEGVDLTDSGAGTTSAAEKDLSWTGFVEAIKATRKTDDTAVKVYTLKTDWATQTNGTAQTTGTAQTNTADGKYRPVSPSYALTYKGNDHSITNVSATGAVADGTGAAGLFGAPTGTPTDSQPWALAVSDLVLYDFEISGSDAGALAGTLPAGSSVTNVLAYHGETAKTVTATGNAGGLIGSMAGGEVEQSAAAMLVSSTGTGSGGSTSGSTGSSTSGSAGGLIGMIDLAANVTVTDSYSGGHTTAKKYDTSSPGKYNIIAASGNAGGLIGAVSKTTSEAPGTINVNYCYSTCSASGNVAGGLIGAVDANGNVSVSYSYAVGKALGGTAEGSATGTFLGSGSLKDREDVDFIYAVDMDSEDLLMPATVVEDDDKWKVRNGALPYDTQLDKQYIYPTVNQLHHIKAIKNEEDYTALENQPVHLSTHYGDWEEIKLLADADLALINAERLSAKITLPKEQIADGGVVTMLIRGETSHPIAVSNDAYDETKDAFLVLKVTKPASVGGEYTLSLSPDSVVPGVTAENLQTWFSKLKKAGVGVKVSASDDAEIELNLDDITKEDGHFAQLFKTFIPGENISVAVKGGVVASDKLNAMVNAVMAHETLNSITKTVTTEVEGSSQSKTVTVAARTNSLFADPKRGTIVDGTDVTAATAMTASAAIANFRHLENLDAGISSRETRLDNTVTGGNSITFTKAYQIRSLVGENITDEEATDGLNWMGFLSKISGVAVDNLKTDELDNAKMIKVYKIDNTTGGHICFIPVNPGAIAYDGQGHSIARVYVNTAENAGLFGTLPSGCTVSNLELIDFDIKSTGEAATAGALAGVNSGATITNVLAFNENHDKMTATVTAVGSAGGLVGSMTGGSVTQSAAALVVSSSGSGGGNAGGLIGTVTGTVTISGSYSGGHTSGGAYSTTDYNVAATSGSAGGLIGNAGPATVTNCYSTCSAKGVTAGGLVGTASRTFTNCYATGLVQGTTETSTVGAFAGSIGSASDCLYFEAVNPGMPALGSGNDDNITELDADLKTYHDFVGAGSTWSKANAYDKKLTDDYGKSFNLRTVSQIGETEKEKDNESSTLFVATHYGDWPMPGILVNNTKNGG